MSSAWWVSRFALLPFKTTHLLSRDEITQLQQMTYWRLLLVLRLVLELSKQLNNMWLVKASGGLWLACPGNGNTARPQKKERTACKHARILSYWKDHTSWCRQYWATSCGKLDILRSRNEGKRKQQWNNGKLLIYWCSSTNTFSFYGNSRSRGEIQMGRIS